MGLPRHERLALLEAVTGKPREFWAAHPKAALLDREAALFDRWQAARLNGAPLAYLLGYREFYGRRFWVGPETLIPRPDTELLIDTAKTLIAELRPEIPPVLADLGTGSGCIAISLALEINGATITACDLSPAALHTARNNAAWLGASPQVSFAQGSWWQAFGPSQQKFHGVVSNPPYIAGNDAHLSQGDLRYEPAMALTPRFTEKNGSGLEAIEAITSQAPQHLFPGGFLLIEHGFDQQPAVMGIFKNAGLSQVRGLRDLSGNPRAVVGFHT